MNKEILDNYAKLIVKVGANVQEGQDVRIVSSVDDAYFTKLVVEEAYKAGARLVEVDWDCQEVTKMNYLYQSTETLCELPKWKEERLQWSVEHLPVMIYIDSADPDGLTGIDQEKFAARQKAIGPIAKKYRDQMTISTSGSLPVYQAKNGQIRYSLN